MAIQKLNSDEIKAALGLCLVLAVAWLAYLPGIGGSFFFDDYANLKELPRAQSGELQSLAQYVFDGATGALGRPLSLVTFGLQAHSWPNHAGDFIRVNVLIHLLNGMLLCWALINLLTLASFERRRAEAIAVCATAVWLITPLQSSAVLYVVQRMTLLSGGFMLAGLLLYSVGRTQLQSSRTSGLLLMTAGVGVGLGLGILAKENAVLFPLLVLVAEFTLLRSCGRPLVWRRWAWVCLGIPLTLFAGYLLWRLPADVRGATALGISSPDRVLSQPRVLLMYLEKMLLPSLYSIRIMYDDLVASTSLLSPWTTLPALLSCVGLLGMALVKRQIWPVASFAILWYFASHSLESSFIALEMAFDHRNYIAIVGPALLLTVGVDRLLAHPKIARIKIAVLVAAGAYFLFMGVAQWHTSSLWSRPYELMAYWSQSQPESRRVSYEVADAHLRNWNPVAALQERERALAHWPGDTSNLLGLLSLGCVLEGAPMPGLPELDASLKQFDGHPITTLNHLDRLVRQYEHNLCPRYPAAFFLAIVDRIHELPKFKRRILNYRLFRARIYHTAGYPSAALDEMDAAIAHKPSPDVYEAAILWALQSGHWERARALLNAAERDTAGSPLFRASYAATFANLREQLDTLSAAGAGR